MPFNNGSGFARYSPSKPARGGKRRPQVVSARDRGALVQALRALDGGRQAPARGSPARRSKGRASYGRPEEYAERYPSDDLYGNEGNYADRGGIRRIGHRL